MTFNSDIGIFSSEEKIIIHSGDIHIFVLLINQLTSIFTTPLQILPHAAEHI